MTKLTITNQVGDAKQVVNVKGVSESLIESLVKEVIGKMEGDMQMKTSLSAKKVEEAKKVVQDFQSTIKDALETTEPEQESQPTPAPQQPNILKAIVSAEKRAQQPKKEMTFLGSETRGSFPIGEILSGYQFETPAKEETAATVEEPPPGTKLAPNGKTTLYQTWLDCPCGCKQKRFAGVLNDYIKCFNCQKKLDIEDVSEESVQLSNGDVLPVPSEEGYYFLAHTYQLEE